MIRVLLADDHEMVRNGLKLLIDSQPDMEVVDEVGTGRLAVQRAKAIHPTVVVLDVSMPEMNGLDAARAIVSETRGVAVVALTRHSDDAYLQGLLGAGARGFVLKQSPSDELLKAVRAAARGETYLDTSVTARVADAFIARHGSGHIPHRRVSERELEVLRLIATGYSNKEIAARLDLSVKTVEVHKANAMRKLDLGGRVDIVLFAILQGWLQDA